jgi:hypothetical protein
MPASAAIGVLSDADNHPILFTAGLTAALKNAPGFRCRSIVTDTNNQLGFDTMPNNRRYFVLDIATKLLAVDQDG